MSRVKVSCPRGRFDCLVHYRAVPPLAAELEIVAAAIDGELSATSEVSFVLNVTLPEPMPAKPVMLMFGSPSSRGVSVRLPSPVTRKSKPRSRWVKSVLVWRAT